MSDFRVLLADGNVAFANSLRAYLLAQNGISCVETASDGETALKLLVESRFDVIITEITLSHIDGFGLLEQISLLQNSPAVMVLSSMNNESIVTRACGLGAKYYMVKPVEPETVYRRIIGIVDSSLSQIHTSIHSKKTLDERVTSIFLTSGIPVHIKGFHYLREAVKMVYTDPDTANKITRVLYPGVAKTFMTTSSKVERAIRHAIEVAWTRGRIENINRIFGFDVYSKNDKPTNGEFIALIADRLSIEDGRNTSEIHTTK